MYYNQIKTLEDFFYVGLDRDVSRVIPDVKKQPSIILNVGAGEKDIEGAIPLDYPEYDFDKDEIPYVDNSVDQIHAYHFLEHLHNPVWMLLEFQRVLKVGGHVNIVVPYYNAQIMAHDLDHKHSFCEDTWKILFSNPYYNKNKVSWRLAIYFNMIMGIVERNLCLFTQLVKKL